LLAIVFVLWIRTAPVTMLTPPQARRSGPGGQQPEGSVDMDNSASFAGEVERNVSPDNDFPLRGQLLATLPLVIGQSAVSTQRKQGSATPRHYWHWGNCAPKRP
jgi:hypothetical protein